MLVEDEPPIMRMVKNTIEQSDAEFVVSECCMNGKKAVEILEREEFDIVITDIKMPIMSGIDLAGWIHENKPETMVIILSGYQDFEYARKALEYKVFDYLLKPFSKDKVKELTVRIRKELNKTNPTVTKLNGEHDTAVVLACAGAYLLYGADVLMPGEKFWADDTIENFMSDSLKNMEGYIFFNSNMQSERLVVVESESQERQEHIIKRLYDTLKNRNLPVTVVYKTGVKFKNAGKQFALLREQLIKRLVLDKSQLIRYDTVSDSYEAGGQPYSKQDIETIVLAVKNGDNDSVRKKLQKLFKLMRDSECTQEETIGLLNMILDTYSLNYPDKMTRKNTSVKKEFVTAVAGFVSYDDFTEDIVSILSTLSATENSASDRYVKLADDIESYLIENYNKNITNDILSKQFGFVPSYISRLFKKEKGISPSEYITKYRINLATKILSENPSIMIKEVADMVGFKEAYYFSKTFKREMGMWPTEYFNKK